MHRLLQLAVAALLVTSLAPSYAKSKTDKPAREDVEWLWQYAPDAKDKDGRESDLIRDARFPPFLQQFFTAPQTFWGQPPKSLADTALDYLSVPDKVIAEQNRYLTISGHVFHFAPGRGMIWIDLNGKHHLVAFAAIDWIKQGRPTSDPAAEYTLWLFPNDPLTVEGPGSGAQHVPAALSRSLARWAAEPLPGTGDVQNITHAVLVDPDGTPHEIPPSALGLRSGAQTSPAGPVVTPNSTASPATEDSAPILAPRN
jgi:hypothetical protein